MALEMAIVVRNVHFHERTKAACAQSVALHRMGKAAAKACTKTARNTASGANREDASDSGSSGVSSDFSEPVQESSLSQADSLWDRATSRLVDYSTLAFVLLLLPQLIKNAAALRAENYDLLAGLAWAGFLTALMANTQLAGYFLDKGESSAAGIQIIGVLSNYAVLLQPACVTRLFLTLPELQTVSLALVSVAGLLPAPLVPALIAAGCLSALVFSARALNRLTKSSRLWHAWQAGMAVIGIITVPQVLWGTFTNSHSLAPAILASIPAFALVVVDATRGLPGWLQEFWGLISAWTATLLFCCQPVAQLASNFAHPEGVLSLSLGTLALATIGNAMMVPRALYTKDIIWTTGSLWGSLAMGLGNLLSLALANSRFGIGSFTLVHFSLAGTVMAGYFSFVGYMHNAARKAARSMPSVEQPLLNTPGAQG